MKNLIVVLVAAFSLQAQTPATAKAEQTNSPITKPNRKAAQSNPDGTIKIDITLGELYGTQPALKKLFGLDLPIKTAWGLRKNIAAIDIELKRFDDQLADLRKKHGTVKDGNFDLPPTHAAAFNKDINALAEIRVDLTITPVSMAAIPETAKLSASDIVQLEAFLIP